MRIAAFFVCDCPTDPEYCHNIVSNCDKKHVKILRHVTLITFICFLVDLGPSETRYVCCSSNSANALLYNVQSCPVLIGR